jgi:hypothetical protein
LIFIQTFFGSRIRSRKCRALPQKETSSSLKCH